MASENILTFIVARFMPFPALPAGCESLRPGGNRFRATGAPPLSIHTTLAFCNHELRLHFDAHSRRPAAPRYFGSR